MNGTQYNMLASSFDSSGNVTGTITLTGALAHIMRNNIGYPNKNSNMTGVDTMFNTWDLNITPAAKDFASITDPSVSGTGVSIESSGALGPRAADGSMPAIDFLKLVAGSQMIDKGTDVAPSVRGRRPRPRRLRIRRGHDHRDRWREQRRGKHRDGRREHDGHGRRRHGRHGGI